MPQLKTLVPDIYSLLSKLSDGTPIDIPEEELDKTMQDIKEAIVHWNTPQQRDGFTLRMSNVGQPARRLWFDSREENLNAHPVSASTQMKFLYGHILEQILLLFVRLAGHKITHEQEEVSVDGITGHMDSVIDGEVVDIKTASNFAFRKFVERTLPENDPFGYLTQLSGYEESQGSSEGGFLVINKETGQLCLYIPDDLDKPNIQERISELRDVMLLDDPPDLCYTPIPHGTKGNRKLPSPCVWCPHKFKCHEDSNDGQGLRTFQYSKGPVYFTDVIDTPRVEEIL